MGSLWDREKLIPITDANELNIRQVGNVNLGIVNQENFNLLTD